MQQNPTSAIHRLTVPDFAPPFDDEPASSAPADGPEPAEPLASPAEPESDQGEGSPSSRNPRGDGGGGWPSQFAQVLAETLAGSRPASQLTPWTTEETRRRIRQLGPLLATGQRPRVRKIMTSAPRADVLEMTAVVGFGPRVRVLALRLERAQEVRQHWRCTAIESA